MSSIAPAATFGQEHFGQAFLGDKRRTRCLIDLADRFARHPGGTLPHKCKDPLALRRCYDLMNVPAVTHQSVLTPHIQRTLALVAEQAGVVLFLHDGSELNFSQLSSLADQLGQVGDGTGKGYQCLNSLAVLPASRRPLGLVNQILFKRPTVATKETRAQKRDRENRESLLWLRAVDDIEEATRCCRSWPRPDAAGVGPRVVDVVDRGGDTFEFLDHEALVGRLCLIRSEHNRAVGIGHDGHGPTTRLHDYLRTLAEQGRRTIALSDRPQRPAREATVAVAWAAVLVYPPDLPRGKHRDEPLPLWGLHVWEPEPPAGVEAVEWFLLSAVAVADLKQAWEKVDWYTCRWVIEEFHKAQKTGCDIEAPQFTRVERLEPMIALLSVVALTLLDLRSASRDEQARARPATERVDAEYVEVLCGWRYREQRALTVGEFFLALARLGGHQNRKGDGAPGWLVLWRGWTTLQTMVEGARAVRCHQKRRSRRDQIPDAPDPDG